MTRAKFRNELSSCQVPVGILILLLISTALQFPATSIQTTVSSQQSMQTPPEDLEPRTVDAEHSLTPEVTFAPAQLEVETHVTHTENSYDGYNLFVITERFNIISANHYAVITDMDGNIIHEKFIGSGYLAADVPVEMIGPRTALLGTPLGAALWDLYDNSLQYLGFTGHHEFEYNDRDNTFFVLQYKTVNIDGTDYLYDEIVEYNHLGGIVWSLDTSDFIDPDQWCPYLDFYQGLPDITHGNTIYYDQEDDIIYYNSRNTNTFYKIDHATGDVLWGLGEYGDFTLHDIEGNEREDIFFHTHAVEPIDENTFILFDNDYHNQTNFWNQRSRILEIEVDEVTMTASESWVWTAPISYYSALWGDADRLPNGNRLGVFGTYTHPETNYGARLVEVDDGGNVVWEMSFPPAIGVLYGVYRAERIQLAPTLTSPDDILVLPDSSVELTWQTWYNYRPKRDVQGSYSLLLNSSEIDNGDLTFDKYWRPTDIEFELGYLPRGGNNVTLVVYDESGYIAVDTVYVWVGAFGIWRQGPSTLEIGEPDTKVRWIGQTATTLQCIIEVDDVIFQDFEWTGRNIVYDLANLDIGTHSITLDLINGTEAVHTEVFNVDILAPSLPLLTSPPGYVSRPWDSSLVLTWEFYDIRPSNWTIYVNGRIQSSASWSSPSYTLEWNTPHLDSGVHWVALIVRDKAGHSAASKIELEILAPSPPVILQSPLNCFVDWGSEGVVFHWEIRGGSEWALWRNGSVIVSGEVTSNLIDVPIADWLVEAWFIGSYNLTFQVSDENSSSTATFWLRVTMDLGDQYADEMIADCSYSYLEAMSALGAPDNEYATIYFDYENGRLTLDMGQLEEIVDGDGPDFTVFAVGNYTVSVSGSIDQMMQLVGHGEGTESFDLADIHLSAARYVVIEYFRGDSVLLDAIQAINWVASEGDDDPPIVTGPEDVSGYQGQIINLNWEAHDITPFMFRIYLNDTLAGSYAWSDILVVYDFLSQDVGIWTVKAEFWDYFGNTASDTVLVDILEGIAPIPLEIGIVLVVSGSVGIIALAAFMMRRKMAEQN